MTYSFSDNSTWDLVNHIAIPTQKYIKDTTGVDLSIFGGVFVGAIDGKIKQLTLDAKMRLFSNKSQRVQNVLSYYIAYDRTYNTNWLNYVTSYIMDSLDNPDQVSEGTKSRMRIKAE